MAPLIIDDADTTLTVTIRCGGEEATQTLDLAAVAIDLGVVSKKAGSDNKAWLQGVADYLQAQGFPRPSLTSAKRFWDAVSGAMETLKKRDGGSTTPG